MGKLSCVRQLSQTVMKWKNDCDKKRFIANYVNNKILPNKQRTKLQNIFYFWKNRALSMHYGRYDEIWQKRLETVSKKIIEQFFALWIKEINKIFLSQINNKY